MNFHIFFCTTFAFFTIQAQITQILSGDLLEPILYQSINEISRADYNHHELRIMDFNKFIFGLFLFNKSVNQQMKKLWSQENFRNSFFNYALYKFIPKIVHSQHNEIFQDPKKQLLAKQFLFCGIHLSPSAVAFIKENIHQFSDRELIKAFNFPFIETNSEDQNHPIYVKHKRQIINALETNHITKLKWCLDYYLTHDFSSIESNPNKKRKL